MSDSSDNKVGYGKPPKAFQFKKGQSGNPRGRPSRPKTTGEVLAVINRELIPMMLNGQRRWVTPLEAAARKTLQMTLQKGNPRDLKYLFELLKEEGFDWREEQRAEVERNAASAMQMISRVIDQTFDSDRIARPYIDASEERECQIIADCHYCSIAIAEEQAAFATIREAKPHGTGLKEQIETMSQARGEPLKG